VKFLHYFRNSRMRSSGDFFVQLNLKLGIKPKTKKLFKEAFTHSSVNLKNEEGNSLNYERLEFLGDSLLNTVVAEYLFFQFPESQEGALTKLRAKIVSRKQLNFIGKEMGLIELAALAPRHSQTGDNIHGNLVEALVGALFVDQGYQKTKAFTLRHIIDPYIDIENLETLVLSYKAFLIEWGQKEKKKIHFETSSDNGLDPNVNYSCQIFLDDKTIAKARALSKKKAEEKAARIATHALKIKPLAEHGH